MTNKKTLSLKHNELVKLISESVMEICAKRIVNEQGKNSKKYIQDTYSPTSHEKTTLQIEEKAFKVKYHPDVIKYLRENGVKPMIMFTGAMYNKLTSQTKKLISGHVWIANKALTRAYTKNTATAQGQKIYIFLPSQRMVNLPEVKICWDKELNVSVDCDSRKPYTGLKGFDVNPNTAIQSLFGYEVTEPLNTKYFCPTYLMDTGTIPKAVRPRVFKWLQQSFSNKDGRNLGLNNISGSITADSQLMKNLYAINKDGQKMDKLMSGTNILKVVSDYAVELVTDLESRYNTGDFNIMAGNAEDKENQVPLSHESHQEYFDGIKDFSNKLKQTDCGFGVSEGEVVDIEQKIREKYSDIMAFSKIMPENWEEMDDTDKEKFMDDYNTEISKIESQDDIQFIFDMIGLGLTLVGAILLAIPSGGASLAVWGGIMLASGVVVGVGSAMYDYSQGQYVLGTTSLALELIPFAKVFKLTKLLKHVPPKTINEMFAYAMKNGPRALSVKQFGEYSGKELYSVLMKNKDELIDMLSKSTKGADDFLKTFASMDAMEYYFLLRTSKPFKTAFKNTDFKTWKSGMNELSDIVFANKTYFKSFFKSFRYEFSKPMKVLLANIVLMPPIVLADCFDVEFRLIKKVDGKMKLIHQVGKLVPGLKTSEDNIKLIKVTIEPSEAADSTCMLLDMILSRMTGTPDQATNDYMKMLLAQDNIVVNDKDITVTINGGTDEEKEIDLLAIESGSGIVDIADGLKVAIALVFCQDEDIYATMIYHLGNGDLDAGSEMLNGYIKNGCLDIGYWDLMDWLVTQDIYKDKQDDLLKKIATLRQNYE